MPETRVAAPISESVAAKQLRRFSRLPSFPDSSGLKELVAMLWRHADDEAHAERAVDVLLERCHFCPTPADIHDACNETRISVDDAWKPNLDPCPECGGSGWRIIQRGRYTAAERCPCGDGKARRGAA